MRKILSALLAVMMLIGVMVVPAFAATEPSTVVKSFDGTEGEYDSVNLIVTEVMTNSKSDDDDYNEVKDELSTSKFTSYDNFDYIEIYNKGDEAVNLYDYCLLRADYKGSTIPYLADKVFTHKNSIAPGDIYNETYGVKTGAKKQKNGVTYNNIKNPDNTPFNESKDASQQLHWLLPGHFAVIWFWTGNCDTVSYDDGKSMADPAPQSSGLTTSDNAYYFPRFRDFYNVPDETIVLTVYAQNNSNALKSFDLSNHDAKMYAIAKKDYALEEAAVTTSGGSSNLNDKVESLFCWGVGTKAGIPTSDGADGSATNFMPPNSVPGLYQAEQKSILKDKYDASKDYDYVQTGHSISYREMAIYRYSELPTVGAMPLYQWAYIDPVRLQTQWADLKDRAIEELPDVVRALEDEALADEISRAVDQDGSIPDNLKASEKTTRYNAAIANGELDTRTQARLESESYASDLKTHYDSLLRQIVSDYDEVAAYKVQDGDGNDTTDPLLFDADGSLLTQVVEGKYTWASRVIDRFLKLNVYQAPELGDRTEVDIDVNLQDREELDKMYGDGADKANQEWIPEQWETVKKLTTWGLILIIAGAVIGVAGIAVAVILVIKKKNKPVAADDVAAEGDVEIIDEGADEAAAAEASAEEAVAEEAATEETPSEE